MSRVRVVSTLPPGATVREDGTVDWSGVDGDEVCVECRLRASDYPTGPDEPGGDPFPPLCALCAATCHPSLHARHRGDADTDCNGPGEPPC